MKRNTLLKEKARRDEISGLNGARREGKRETQLEVAKKMKEKNIDINLIIEITGLTKEEVEKL